MVSYGPGSAYERVTLIGYQQLQARLNAIKGTSFGADVMRQLGGLAVREQQALMYTQVTRKTGQAGRQIVLGGVSATSAATVAHNYTVYLDRGTKPHDIRPKAKKVLRWPTSSSGLRLTGRPKTSYAGGFAFAKVVHHPGTRAYDFMIPGAVKAIAGAGLKDRFIARWNEAA